MDDFFELVGFVVVCIALAGAFGLCDVQVCIADKGKCPITTKKAK